MRRLVDVIVPVFLGINETQRCLNSLLNSRQNTDHEIVVINDASPDPRIHELLQTLRQQSAITLIHHAENRGFVASVNEAFDLHPERDVVVLNNDTEVANDWLDRLASCAAIYEQRDNLQLSDRLPR
jgi:GT2 family glycosyltransferase